MFTAQQIADAQAIQHAAAHDPSPCVRLVAGPGTGKSSSIEERVCWLIAQGVSPENIWAVSFTRASSLDLRLRVHAQSQKFGYEAADKVQVTTLHSLALRMLRKANMLQAYPTNPQILDDWEVENIFDAEFGHVHDITKKRRREDIRRAHEAFWSTGDWGPPNYIPPDPEISEAERTEFQSFHQGRTQSYACVLPGEIIRLCVERMEAGLLDGAALLKLEHLIVDEFQDLNPNDLRFVDFLIKQGAKAFIAGDDDQSIYSFRFASPAGIQIFPTKYEIVGDHKLTACWRCPPKVLSASMALIAKNPGPGRIPKSHHSLYSASAPPVDGIVYRWRFGHARHEAKAIAESCKYLIAAGMNPRDILILLSNQQRLARPLIDELAAAGVEAEHPREQSFLDSNTGRLVLAVLRIVCDPDDYVSHRAVLGLRNGVAIGKCTQVYDAVFNAVLNYRSVFYGKLKDGAFKGLALTTITHARRTCLAIADWKGEDTLESRVAGIEAIIQNHYDDEQVELWRDFSAIVPPGATLEELRNFLWADTDEQQKAVLEATMIRLQIPVPEQGVLLPRVRVMTMHGAKGLSGKVVFIPGLEEEIIPGPRKKPYLGLVQEAARMLYVSITRARAACIISFADMRMMMGDLASHTDSRFASHLAGRFAYQNGGLDDEAVEKIMADCGNL